MLNGAAVTDADLTAVSGDIEVYDKTWQREASNGTAAFEKRRFFVERGTFLRKRMEYYMKSSADKDYVLWSINVYDYPSDEQIKAILDF